MVTTPVRMLIADDCRTVHRIFAEAAAQSPWPVEIVAAHDGRECMRCLVEENIHLAFIDVAMPAMSGMEALGAARHFGANTFVTLMSATASQPRIELARELKAYEFLAKPFSIRDVHGVLRTYQRVKTPTRAIIVDDSATVRRVIRKVLAASIFNIAVEETSDGETALAICGVGDFDVVFLDCNMPGLDGIATLERLLACRRDTRVIMMSGERNVERARAARERGAVSFLYKPFYPADVDRALHLAFDLRMPGLIGAIVDPAQPCRIPQR
jgi:DNA-binding NtrC family response regulator